MQEYLNRSEHLWGMVTNGRQLRLLRDSALMTRPSYVEFDLEQMLAGEHFADFAMLYRLMHLWAAGDLDTLNAYVGEKGLRDNEYFWAVAQAVLEMSKPQSRERTLLEALVAWGRGKRAPAPQQERLL